MQHLLCYSITLCSRLHQGDTFIHIHKANEIPNIMQVFNGSSLEQFLSQEKPA